MKITIFCQSLCRICSICGKELAAQFRERGLTQVLLYTLLLVAEREKYVLAKQKVNSCNIEKKKEQKVIVNCFLVFKTITVRP